MKHPHFKTLALLLSLSFLLVLAGCGSSSSSSGTSPANAAPVAEAGADQHIKTGDTINLDGSGSSDADHDLLTYSWVLTSQPDGSADIFTGVDTSHPGFSADIDGDYVFTLTVNDGSVNSSEDTVTVTQETANSLPVADPGPDRFMKTGTTITLDGSGSSDADHDLLTFSWSMVTQAPLSTPVLTGANTSHPTFATDVDGIYTLQLVVNDGSDSSPQIVKINQSPDAKPVANAGPDQPVVKTISVDLHVALDGSGSSDADHDLLTYSWTTQSKPDTSAMVLKDTDTSHPTFAADVDGVYVIKLIVNDGSEDSAADTVTVSLANVAPVANAGPDQHDKMGVTLTLDGSGSKDANIADILTFAWTVMDGTWLSF